MSAKNRPYEQFGSFILFKKLETDALGDLWRAGRVDNGQLGPTMAIRRLLGGNRAALTASAGEAHNLVPLLAGTTFAKDQTIDVANGIPFVAHEYAGGRSLRHIVDRARGGNGVTANPIPLDQAIVIAEKIALSLATTADLRYLGNRLAHGALIPQFVWITDEGEIRVGGQQIGKGLIASLSDAKVGAELGRYFAAEYRASGDISKTTDVYSLGAILYLLVTGLEPPDAVTGSAFAQTIRAAKTFAGQPLPDDLRAIIEKSLAIDPNARYATINDMKQVLSALVHGGNYSASTFNLAFYLSNLLKKELEGEALERERESKVNAAAYAEVPMAAVTALPSSSSEEPPAKNRMPLYAAAAAVIIAVGAGAYFILRPKPAPPVVVQKAAPPPRPQVISQPVIAAAPTTTTNTTTAPLDAAAQKKAFEAAVQQKMQEEMMKLQADMNRQLKQQQSKTVPVQTASVISSPQPQQQSDDRGSAAALDQRRIAAQPLTQTQAAQQQPVVPQPQTSAVTAPPPVTQAAVSTVREGDLVDVLELDKVPQPLSAPRPYYPPLAAQQHANATIILSTLISENGDVTDVKVLKGDARFGFNDAAIRAMRAVRFTPPIKDGKRVKTWRPQSITFQQ